MNKYKKTFQKLLLNDSSALMIADRFYKGIAKNQRHKRLEDYGLPDYCYADNYMLHLIQPLLKAQYEHYLSNDLLEDKERYVIKITTTKEDLIFIMKDKSIVYVLLDPFKKFGVKELKLVEREVLLNDFLSMYIFYDICKMLDCLTIERYWDFIITIAIKYSFYPTKIFSKVLSYPQPGFCLYSGEPIIEGYFKDPKARSDFFNRRYFGKGLFGKNVLCYSKQLDQAIKKGIKNNEQLAFEHFKKVQRGARKYDPNKHKHFNEETIKMIKEFKLNSEDELKGWAINKASLQPITVDQLKPICINCAKYLSKKVNGICHKFENRKFNGDILADGIIKTIGHYFLENRYDQDFDFLDILLLMPALHPKTATSLFKRNSSGEMSLFRDLIEKCLPQIKKEFLKSGFSETEFYTKIIQCRPAISSGDRFTKQMLDDFVTNKVTDPFCYRKVLYVYKTNTAIKINDLINTYAKLTDNKNLTNKDESFFKEYLEVDFDDQIFLDVLNNLLRLISLQHLDTNQTKNRSISLQTLNFYRKDVQEILKKHIKKRLK